MNILVVYYKTQSKTFDNLLIDIPRGLNDIDAMRYIDDKITTHAGEPAKIINYIRSELLGTKVPMENIPSS